MDEMEVAAFLMCALSSHCFAFELCFVRNAQREVARIDESAMTRFYIDARVLNYYVARRKVIQLIHFDGERWPRL